MKVFKFGGASVKDASSVQNVAEVLKLTSASNCFIVISAMGKTTNKLEAVVQAYFNKKEYSTIIEEIQQEHLSIANTLFDEGEAIFSSIEIFFSDITSFLRRNKSPNYDFVYDQVVSCGELISTKIVNEYLQKAGFNSEWLDIRDYIKTDNTYREGKVNWQKTEQNFSKIKPTKMYVSQGFLGSDENYMTVTLGREGSDYTAAIAAYCLNAESMTIWKDVPGVLNADPRYFEHVQLLHTISYKEAVELAYYGASVIHPKTMKPLENKQIPFYIKSFIEPLKEGTVVKKGQKLEPEIPCYIIKKNQHLLEVSSQDFSFITEEHVSHIFDVLAQHKIKVSLIQTSALNLTLCIEDKYELLDRFIETISQTFYVETIRNVSLFTIRHFNAEAEQRMTQDKKVLLKQISSENLQLIIQES